MAPLAEQFRRLKTAAAGNREQTGFEHSFGMPKEELAHITPLTRANARILGELEFALRLSESLGGKFDGELGEALEFLSGRAAASGVLTDSDCARAEEILSPMESEAKSWRLILAGHAHIDMNWMWSYTETVSVVLATFRTVLKLMEEYPQFCFSQSQAAVYRIVEENDPALMEEIKRRIAEGRWEATASAWVECDHNMPDTASLLKHISSTREYLSEKWGVRDFEIDFSPDTFGHSANLPEIDTFGGVKYLYHCRGMQQDRVLYRWRGLSGRELLAYREPCWYNSGIRPQMGPRLIDISRRCAGLKTGLVVYGVGDHGGGPTRRDVERGLEMQTWRIFPTVSFGTFRSFFREAESVREKLPVVSGELNFFAAGCYTTQSRIKRGNRRCEAALCDAETLSSAAGALAGAPFARETMEEAWRGVLFNHFHDIITGSCVQDSREYAMGLYQRTMASVNTQAQNAMLAVAAKIDTSRVRAEPDAWHSQSEGAGAGCGVSDFAGVPCEERGSGLTRIFHIFSTLPEQRSGAAELTVWDWTGDMASLKLTSPEGAAVPFQLLDGELQKYWDHRYFRLLADVTVPPLGYTTVILSQAELERYPLYFQNRDRVEEPFGDFVLENEFLRAVIASDTGRVTSLTGKLSGTELIARGESAGLSLFDTEAETSDAWRIGRHLAETELCRCEKLEAAAWGSLRQSVKASYRIRGSRAEVTYSLDAHAGALRADLNIDWNEVGGETVPVLSWCVPCAWSVGEYRYDIPAGSICRPPMSGDVPGTHYGMAVNPDGDSLFLSSDCKYGYRGEKNSLSLTLINSAVTPDPYPERGIHRCAVFLGALPDSAKRAAELAADCCRGLLPLPGTVHGGVLPMRNSFASFRAESSVLVSLTPGPDGAVTALFCETAGRADRAELEFTVPVRGAEAVRPGGDSSSVPCRAEGNRVSAEIPAYSLAAVRVVL